LSGIKVTHIDNHILENFVHKFQIVHLDMLKKIKLWISHWISVRQLICVRSNSLPLTLAFAQFETPKEKKQQPFKHYLGIRTTNT